MMFSLQIDSLKPYICQFLGRVVPQFVGIAISSVIIKDIGINTYGQYSLLFGIVSFIFGVFGSALDIDFQRSCNATNVFRVLSSKLVMWAFLISVLVFIAWICSFAWLSILFVAIGILFQQAIETRITRDRVLGADLKSILPRIFPVLVFFSLIYFIPPDGLNGLSVLFAISWLTSIVFLLPLFRNIAIRLTETIQTFRRAGPIYLALLMTQVYGNIDLYIIRLFHSDEVVGAYKVAYTFAGMSIPLAGVFSFIYLSKISSALLLKNFDQARAVIRNQLLVCSILGLGLISFMFILFPFVAQMFYGEAGPSMVLPARLLAFAMTLNMLTMVYSYALLALGMDKFITAVTACGALSYLIFGIPLIKIYGAPGAGFAMILTYFILMGIYLWLFNNRFLHQEREGIST